MSLLSDAAKNDPVMAEMIEAVSIRLKPVCADMDGATFDALVLKIARFRVRWGESPTNESASKFRKMSK